MGVLRNHVGIAAMDIPWTVKERIPHEWPTCPTEELSENCHAKQSGVTRAATSRNVPQGRAGVGDANRRVPRLV